MDLSRLQAALEQRIQGDRLTHTRAVTETAVQLAARYGADMDRARVAGLMHDYAKALPPAELLRLGRQFGLVTDPAEEQQPSLLHGPVGAALLEQEGLVHDPEILAAIRWHTTGTPGMSALARIIWIADMIEPGRDFPGVAAIRRLTWRDLDQGLLAGLDHSIAYVIATGRRLHLETVRARNWLLAELAGRGANWPGWRL